MFCTKQELATLKRKLKQKKLTKLQLEKELEQTEAFTPPTTEIRAWCMDYTTDLAIGTIVGTVEVPGERQAVQIQPGYSDNALYSAARDGQIQPLGNNTPAAAFLNVVQLAGWQKWKPLSRYGYISAIDYAADTCTVVLDAALSSAQSIPINPESILTKVPIDYMYCNDVLRVNARVVVLFPTQEWSNPVVRGYESNPERCAWEPWIGPDWCSSGNQWELLAWFFSGSTVTEFVYGSAGLPGWDTCPVDKKDSRFLIDANGFHTNFTVPAGFATGFNSNVKVVPPVIPGTFSKMVFSAEFVSSDETFVRIRFKDSGGAATTANTVLLHFNFGATPPDPAYITPPSFATGNITYVNEEVDISSISQPFQQIEIIHVCGSAGNSINASIKYIDFK